MDLEEIKNLVKIEAHDIDDIWNLIERCEKAEANAIVTDNTKTLAAAIERNAELEAKLSEMEKQAPIKYEFKCHDGNWYGFDSDKHYRNTVESGEFEIRKLYALPVPPITK